MSRSSFWARYCSLALLATVAFGCTHEGESIDLSGQDVSITFLHTADWHSRLVPYFLTVGATDRGLGLVEENNPIGGVARIKTLLDAERATAGPRVLHVDSGDCFQGAPIFNLFSGEAETLTMSAVGVDVAVIGNHEFDRGVENYVEMISRYSTFPVLAANYLYEDPDLPGATNIGNISSPYALFNLEGLRVAVIGLGNFSSITSLADEPNSLGITPLDNTAVTQFYVDFLRPLVDVIVVVSHIGVDDDLDVVSRVEGIDIVLGGHLHVVLNPPPLVEECTDLEVERCAELDKALAASGEERRRVLVVHSGAFMKFFGRLDTVFREAADPRNGWDLVSHRYDIIPIDASAPPDPALAGIMGPYQVALLREYSLSKPVGYAVSSIRRFGSSGGDSPLGNLVAGAMLARSDVFAEFSLTNAGGIRTDLNAGPITVEQLFNVFPFDNSITTLSLAGTEVKEMLDFVARRSASRGCAAQVQVSGIAFTIDCRITSCDTAAGVCMEKGRPCVTNADCAFPLGCDLDDAGCVSTECNAEYGLCEGTIQLCGTDDDCGPNSTEIFMGGLPEEGGLPVRPNLVYTMAGNDYIAAGGSGFDMLARNTTQLNTGISLRDAVQDYIIGIGLCTRAPGCDSDCADAACIGDPVCACADELAAMDRATLCLGILDDPAMSPADKAVCSPEELRLRAETLCADLSCADPTDDGRIKRILP